jgi:hypothetical protein
MTEICRWGIEEIFVIVNDEIGAREPDVVFITPRLEPMNYFLKFKQIALM